MGAGQGADDRALAEIGDDEPDARHNEGERDAAIVGRHVTDKDLQAPILQHLAQDSPDTAEEAELFVRQALAAGANKEVQGDMFGSFIKADLILPQRVKILKGALSTLRRDKALFSTLTERAGAIQAAGNVLNVAENAARGETAARAFATLKALAERKGRISDALQSAAEDAARTGNRRAATQRFVQDVRDAISRGDFDGREPGAAIGDLDAPAADLEAPRGPGNEPALKDTLSLFGDPVEKPEAFTRQSQDLAGSIEPAREPPVAAFRRQLAEIEKNLPAVPPEHTRLWRGNRPGEIGQNPHFTNDAAGIAMPFRQAYRGELSYVDVPTADLARYEDKGAVAPGAEFSLPPEIAAKAKSAEVNPAKSEFGNAQPEIEAMRVLDQEATMPNPHGDGEVTVREVRRQMEQEARTVEALRKCGGFDGV